MNFDTNKLYTTNDNNTNEKNITFSSDQLRKKHTCK